MAELKNTLSWSFSRNELFQSCKRAYYFSYYLSWGGWEYNAPPRSKLAYRLKKMTSVDAFIGSTVHAEISHIVGCLCQAMDVRVDEERLLRRIDRAFEDSMSEKWIDDPKRNTCFHEDYYGEGFTDTARANKKQKALSCIETFLGSPMYDKLAEHARGLEWLWIDNPQSRTIPKFPIEDFEAIAKIDLAVRAAGSVTIVDFKTGKPTDGAADPRT